MLLLFAASRRDWDVRLNEYHNKSHQRTQHTTTLRPHYQATRQHQHRMNEGNSKQMRTEAWQLEAIGGSAQHWISVSGLLPCQLFVELLGQTQLAPSVALLRIGKFQIVYWLSQALLTSCLARRASHLAACEQLK